MMMESNCEMKTTTMKTQSTQPRKEKFNDSFFIRKSIVSAAVNDNDKQNSIQDLNTISNDTSNLFIPGKPGTDDVTKSTAIDHKKNSFMKKFLRNHFVLAIAFVIANLFFANNVNAQILQRGTATTALGTTSVLINTPTGVVAGDVMLACVGHTLASGTATAATSPGWTLINGSALGGSTRRFGTVLYKVATASEPANYTFTTTSAAAAA